MGAPEIAVALAASRKAVRLYPPEHPTHREAVQDLVQAVTEAIDVRPLVLNLREGRLYEGSDVLSEASPATRALAEAMEARLIESLTFHMGFERTDATGLSEVLSLRPDPELEVQVELEKRGVKAATVSELEDNSSLEAEERDRKREADKSLYRAALTALKNTVEKLQGDELVDPVEITRTAALLIERIAEDPHAILALAMMTGHGERWRFHSANVMLYSLVIGQRIGLSDQELLKLGTAALLHDAGNILHRDYAQPDEPEHPIEGAHELGALLEGACAPMVVAYEHHMGVDGSGWPERPEGHTIHPFARIVAVANRYHNMTSPPYGDALRPDEALARVLREASGGPLDPLVALVFAGLVGPIPVGTVVRLSDNSVGIVYTPGEDPLRPCLRMLYGPDGVALRPVPSVCLAEDERFIVEPISGELLDIQPAESL